MFIPATALAQMMGGRTSFDAKTNRLTMRVGGRQVALNTAGRTALVNGKTVSFAAGMRGSGASLQISTNALASLVGASVKTNLPGQTVQINFTGN